MNFFHKGMDGRRYAESRPYIHSTAIQKFRSFASTSFPFARALDAGCGTGQSSVALVEIAESIIAIDPSPEMLTHAEPHPQVQYQQSVAEKTPFADGQFDLITVALAFHWFDQQAFLAESHRLLRTPGWLVIYTSWFTGELIGASDFLPWFRGEYLRKFVSPARNQMAITSELANEYGFWLRGADEFSNEVSMSRSGFTNYQLSTTNILAAVERGEVTISDAEQWLRESLEPFFAGAVQRTFLFRGKIWYLEKAC